MASFRSDTTPDRRRPTTRNPWGLRPVALTYCVLGALALAAGCAPGPAREAVASRTGAEASAEVAVPPKQLVEDLRRVLASPPLSLGVEGEDRGTLVTGWKRFRGDWHIGRHWQE